MELFSGDEYIAKTRQDWRAVRQHVEVGVKEGMRETGRERVRHEGRRIALAGDEDARPGGWWLGRRLRPAWQNV